MEIVRVSGIRGGVRVDKEEFTEQVKGMFGDNPEIGNFSVKLKPYNVFELAFGDCFDAMEGQRVLHRNTYTCPWTQEMHVLRAKMINNRNSSVVYHSPEPEECRVCGQRHLEQQCPWLIGMPVRERRKLVRARGLCYACLEGHRYNECPQARPCGACGGPHHPLLCTRCDLGTGSTLPLERRSPPRPPQPTTSHTPAQECRVCGQRHLEQQCPWLIGMPVRERRKLVWTRRLCYACFEGHRYKECPQARPCGACGGPHHPLLCTRCDLGTGSTLPLQRRSPPRPPQPTTSHTPAQECRVCGQRHLEQQCPWLIGMPVRERRKLVRTRRLCYACFEGHRYKECPQARPCGACGGPHHPLLCTRCDLGTGSTLPLQRRSPPRPPQPTTSHTPAQYHSPTKDLPESLELKYLKKKLKKLKKKLREKKTKKEKRSSKKRSKRSSSSHREHDEKRSSRKRLLSGGSSDRSSHSSQSRDRRSSVSHRQESVDKETSKKKLRAKAPASKTSDPIIDLCDDDEPSHTKRPKEQEPSVDRPEESSYKIPILQDVSSPSLSEDERSPRTRRSKVSRRRRPDVQEPSGRRRPDVQEPSGRRRPDVQEPSGRRRSDVQEPSGTEDVSSLSLSEDERSPRTRRSKVSRKRRLDVQETSGSRRTDVQEPSGRRRPDVQEPSGRRRPDVQEPSGRRRSDVQEPSGTEDVCSLSLSEDERSPRTRRSKVSRRRRPDVQETSGSRRSDAQEPSGRRRPDVQEPSGRRRPDVQEPSGRRRPDVQEPSGRRRPDAQEPSGRRRPDVQESSGRRRPDVEEPSGRRRPDVEEPSGRRQSDVQDILAGETFWQTFYRRSGRGRSDVQDPSGRRRPSPHRANRWRMHDERREISPKSGYSRDNGSKLHDRGNKDKIADGQLDSSSNSSTVAHMIDTEVPDTSDKTTNLQKKLLAQVNSTSNYKFLHEHESRLQRIVDELMNHVNLDDLPNFQCLQDNDKNIVYEALRRHVVTRLTNMQIPNNLDTVSVILDYKCKYATFIDKNLFNAVTMELITLGPEKAQSMNSEELSEVIGGVLQNVQIDKILEDTKPDVYEIQQELKAEDADDAEEPDMRRININIQLVATPIWQSCSEETEPPDNYIYHDVPKIKRVARAIRETRPTKLFMPVRFILKDMQRSIYESDVPCEILVEKLKQVLEIIIPNLLIDREKMRSVKVVERFRKAYPIEKDGEFVRDIANWFSSGAFEDKDILEKLLITKQENHEIEDGEISEEEDDDSILKKQESNGIIQKAKIKTEENPELKPELPDITEEINKLEDIINAVNEENSELTVKQEISNISEEVVTEEINTVKKENVEPIAVKQELPDISEEMEGIDDVINSVKKDNVEPTSVKQEIPDISEEMDGIDDVINSVKRENDEPTMIKQELPDVAEEMDTIDEIINSCGGNNRND